MPSFEFDGREHFYEYRIDPQASGPPVLLLLPQSSGPVGIEAFVERLAQGHGIVRLSQQAGHNDGPDAEALSIAWLAAQTQALVQATGADSVHLVCHSTGCGIGQLMVAREPARVASLTLITPWTHADAHLHTMQTLRVAAARSLNPQQYQRFNAAILFPPQYRRQQADGFARMAAEATHEPDQIETFASRLNAILAFDARPLWQSIRCATLVIAAADDQLMPKWFAEETAAAIAKARLHSFEYGGHMLPETRAAQVADAIVDFIVGVESGERS